MKWVLSYTCISLILITTMVACAKDSRKSADLNSSPRQRMMDEASIVCRDGTAYLLGRGPFAVPYIRDGKFVRCVPDADHLIDADGRSS